MGRGDAAASARWGVHLDRPEPRPQRLRVHPQPASELLTATHSERSLVAGDHGPGQPGTERGSPVRAPTEVDVTLREPEVDAASGSSWSIPVVTGSAIWDLAAQDRTMLWTVVGSVAITS